MNASDTKRKILDAVDAGFDAQLATTRDFVAIPSTRGAEGPCQDMIGDLLRRRGYEVDDWHIDVDDLKDLRGFGPIEALISGAHRGRDLAALEQRRQIADPAGALRRGADRPARHVGDAAVFADGEGRHRCLAAAPPAT